MARNALLPAYEMPGGINFNPLSNALSNVGQIRRDIDRTAFDQDQAAQRMTLAQNADTRAAQGQTFSQGMETNRFNLAKEGQTFSQGMETNRFGLAKNEDARAARAADDMATERRSKMLGNMGLAIFNAPDEAQATAMVGQLRKLVPGFEADATKHGLNLNDPRGLGRILAARAGVLPGPLEDIQLKTAQRAFESPKLGKAEFKPGESLVFYNESTGKQVGEPLTGPAANTELGPYKDMKQRADVEESLRKEVTAAAKEYNTINDVTYFSGA